MPIEDRNLEPGTKLVARYKKELHTCEVVAGEDGKVLFSYGGKTYTSPSAAGSAVMGGTACNGWRFWSPEGQEPPAKEGRAKPETSTRKAADGKKIFRQIKRVPNQSGVPEGQTKFFCSSCMASFVAASSPLPVACPEGHPREVEDEVSPGGQG